MFQETEIKIVKRLALDGFVSEANKLLDNALQNLINDCKKDSFNYPIGLTKLDRGRAKILFRKMVPHKYTLIMKMHFL